MAAMAAAAKITTLKKRAEFLRLRGGARCATASFVLETRRRPATSECVGPDNQPPKGGPRFGFTVTKQIGGAVIRNRVKRRLRAAVAGLGPTAADANHDYVLIARSGALSRPFAELQKDLERALQRVHHAPGRPQKGK